jgi:hypothetical protein
MCFGGWVCILGGAEQTKSGDHVLLNGEHILIRTCALLFLGLHSTQDVLPEDEYAPTNYLFMGGNTLTDIERYIDLFLPEPT